MQIEKRPGHYPNDCFKRGRGLPGLDTGLIEQGKAQCIQRPDAPQNHLPIEGFLVTKMIINRRQIGICRFGNSTKGNTVKSMLGKLQLGRIEDAGFGG